MVKRFIALGRVAPAGDTPGSRRPGLASGPGIWRPGAGAPRGGGAIGGGPSPGVDPVVVSSADYMAGQGWSIRWQTAGQVYFIVRPTVPDEFEINRPYLDGCDYSSLPGPMHTDLARWAELNGVCE